MKFEAFTTAPKIFTDKESTVEIPCSADDKMETLTCTLTKDHMESGKKYKIAYQKMCEGEKAETGAKWAEMAGRMYKYYMVFETKNPGYNGAYSYEEFMRIVKEL